MKNKEANKSMPAVGQIPAAHVRVLVDVTKIVKYLSLAGVAIVGIIFGTKYMISAGFVRNKEEE